MAAALATRVLAGLRGRRILDIVRVWGYTTVPIAISLHIGHELEHFVNDAGKVFMAALASLGETIPGLEVLLDIDPGPLASGEALFWLQMALVFAGLAVAVRAAYRLAMREYPGSPAGPRVLVPQISLALAFGPVQRIANR